ncbi:MAG: 50S ribosomal protein L23 [Desulfobulbaceae bacterium]|nr:MAG: 50S ribosomal protein L23 [Desulfobulbaceae bacterium]
MNNLYNIIKKPCLTEKGMTLQETDNQVVFKVDPRANKMEIKQAVEQLFDVQVNAVRTCKVHGKKKRMGRHMGQRADWKKAIVSLAEGSSIDFLEEL